MAYKIYSRAASARWILCVLDRVTFHRNLSMRICGTVKKLFKSKCSAYDSVLSTYNLCRFVICPRNLRTVKNDVMTILRLVAKQVKLWQ